MARAFRRTFENAAPGRAENNRHAAPEREEPAEIEQPRADDGNAADRQHRARDPRRPERFARDDVMREHHSEDGDRRLQDRGQPRRNVKLRPEKQGVVDREHEHARPRQQFEVAASGREQRNAPHRNRQENDDRDDKTKRDERDRREIAQPELDGEPGRAPDDAERHERGDRRHSGSLFRHRLAAHQLARRATAFNERG